MSLRKNVNFLFALIAIPVGFVIIGAFVLSGAAMRENLRYIHSTDDLLRLVSLVRTIADGQKGFAQNPGEDIWSDLEHVGQIAPNAIHQNPWQGDLRVVTVGNSSMRIESDLPTRDCRRAALYFLAGQPTRLGLTSIQAQAAGVTQWAEIYPPIAGFKSEFLVNAACGTGADARLALVFLIRK